MMFETNESLIKTTKTPIFGGFDAGQRVQMQYQRTREMTLDDMLLENRIIFMIGEIHIVWQPQ
jgi:hypothetical protein